jgi:hypothetical protein
MLFLISLVPPIVAFPPPEDPDEHVYEPEIAVKIEGNWHHTMHEWDFMVNRSLPDDGWFTPYMIEPPALCTEFDVEIWLLDFYNLSTFNIVLMWNWCWLELTEDKVEIHGLPGPGEGMTAGMEIVDADMSTVEFEPMLSFAWTYLRDAENDTLPCYTGDAMVATLTFHVIQDPTWPDSFYSLFYLVPWMCSASTCCGEEIETSKQHAVAKLHSLEPVVTKELSKNITWIVGDEITVDINIANVTKLKSFEFVLNYPEWLEIDMQKDPITMGDFLPGPYE